MTIPPVLTLLLLAHVIGDFYLQTNKMAVKKNESFWWLLLHGGLYALCVACILFIGGEVSRYWIFLVLGVSLSHLTIDVLRIHIPRYIQKRLPEKPFIYIHKYFPKKPFIIDQLLHITTIIALWWIWGGCVTMREFDTLQAFLSMFGQSPTTNVLTLLGLLIILRPVGILIEKGEIWDFDKDKNKRQDKPTIEIRTTPDENQKGAGKMIGYLERIIVFFLLINNQFGAIAFVLTAKSVMRFPEIGKSDNASSLAEFYIIGTLLSMTSVFIVAFGLGLLR